MRIRSSTPLHVIVAGILALAVISQQLTREQQGSGNACMQNCRMNLVKSNATLPLYWAALVCDQELLWVLVFLNYVCITELLVEYFLVVFLCTLRFIWCWSGCKCLKEVERRKECSGTCTCMLVDMWNTVNSYNYWVCKLLL